MDQTLEAADPAEEFAKSIPDQDCLRLPPGGGTKGPRLFDGTYLPLGTIQTDTLDASPDYGVWARVLQVRRSPSDGRLTHFMTLCPAGTVVQPLVTVRVPPN